MRRRQQPSMLLCALAAVPPVTSGNLLQQLQGNYVFVVGFWAWAAAQFMKVRPQILCKFCLEGWMQGSDAREGLPSCDGCPWAMQIFTKRMKEGIWDITAVVDSGGMPSSHSALCMVRAPAPPPPQLRPWPGTVSEVALFRCLI